MQMHRPDPPLTTDLFAARRDWLTLFHIVATGQTILITHGGRPIAQLGPPNLEHPESPAPPLVHDLSTATCCARLSRLYGSTLFASLLGISTHRVASLIRSGLADESLFDRLTFLDQLASVVFHSGTTREGLRWLTRSHPKLKGHSPALALAQADLQRRQQVLALAQRVFRQPPEQ